MSPAEGRDLPRVDFAGDAAACYQQRVERTCFDILAELFARDVDRELLRRSSAKTPSERLAWLEEMQAFAEAARSGAEGARDQ